MTMVVKNDDNNFSLKSKKRHLKGLLGASTIQQLDEEDQ